MKLPTPDEAYEQWLNTSLLSLLVPGSQQDLGPRVRASLPTLDAMEAAHIAFVHGYMAGLEAIKAMAIESMKAKGIPIPNVVPDDNAPKTPQ